MTMTLEIPGRLRPTEVTSFSRASALYSEMRDASDEGYHTWPNGELRSSCAAYRISYNGKVWLGDEGDADLIYNPYEPRD